MSRFFYFIALVVSFLAIGVGIAGYGYYSDQKKRVRQQNYEELSAVAGLKVNEISRWRGERIADAYSIMNAPFIGDLVQRCFQSPADPRPIQAFLKWMTSYKNRFDYFSVCLLDVAGSIRLSLPEGEETDDHLMRPLSEALEKKEPILSDLERSEKVQYIHLDLIIPIFSSGETERSSVGAILLRIDPHKFLYPLIQSWSAESYTDETLLVRREGNEVVFLNDLRHQKDTALSLRLPISDLEPLWEAAGSGKEGVFEGLDYRGASVLSVIRPIPDTPWFLIAKIDEEEIYAPARERAMLITFLLALMVAGSGGSVWLIWSNQRSKLLLEERKRSEGALLEVNESLERRVRERTADYMATNERLKQEIQVRTRAEQELRAVTVRLADKEESERRRLSRELHDRVGQNLTALSFNISTVMNLLHAESSPEAVSRMKDSLKLVTDTVACVRDVMADLRPPLLDDYGLAAVLRWYCREFSKRSGIPVNVKCEEETPRLTLSAETALFRIAQEALQNVMRHAHADRITTELTVTDEALRMTIADNGVGFDPQMAGVTRGKDSGWGMVSMRERAETVGGRLCVDSAPGDGTRIIVEVRRKSHGDTGVSGR